jgi:hypothetical protein
VQKTQKLAFADGLRDLEGASAEVIASGGAGLSTDQLSDLYLYRAMAIEKADWKESSSVDEATRARAFEDYVRAATLTPQRALSEREIPPRVHAAWKKAVAEVGRRARGILAVKASSLAQISLDGRPEVSGADGASFSDLPHGEHLIRVEEPGRVPWGTVVPLAAASLEIEVPTRKALTLDDAAAASHARRMGAKFALVAEMKLGDGPVKLELRLVDIIGIRHDAAVVPLAGEKGAIDAAVMRLDEQARRIIKMGLGPSGEGPIAVSPPPSGESAPPLLTAPPPARATLRDDPGGWARDHWPLLTAVGVMVGAILVLGIAVAGDEPRR